MEEKAMEKKLKAVKEEKDEHHPTLDVNQKGDGMVGPNDNTPTKGNNILDFPFYTICVSNTVMEEDSRDEGENSSK